MRPTAAPLAAVRALCAAAALALLGACAAGPAAGPAARGAGGTPARAALVRTAAAPAVRPSKVLVVVEENHTEAAALRRMPYLAGLGAAYGRTSAYRAVTHPSLPNYLALAGGATFGVRDDSSPAAHPLSGPSVFDAALAAGRTAKTYAEAMPAPCALRPSGRYAVKHNPWAYFADPASRRACRTNDVPAGTPARGALRQDITAGALPTVGMLVPDLCHDGHDCPLSTADGWLRGWLPVVLAGPDFRAGRLAVVVTFDEDDTSGPNTVLTVVVAPGVRHVVTAVPLTHYSLARYAAELAGRPPLRLAAAAPSLRSAFPL